MSKAANCSSSPVIVDLHSDIASDVLVRRRAGDKNILDNYHYGRLSKGGVNLQVIAVYVEERHKPHRSLEETLAQLEVLLEEIEESKHFFLIKNKKDLEMVAKDDRIGVIIDLEGAEALEPGIDMLHLVHRLGVRMIGLTWNQRNALASGRYDNSSGGGLTDYGKKVISEFKNLGIMLDVCHMSQASMNNVLDTHDSVIVASHAAVNSVYDSGKGLTDEQICKIAKTGGIVGVVAFPTMLSSEKPSVENVVDHIEKVISLTGEDHVGIGADFIDYFDDLIEKKLMGEEWIIDPAIRTIDFWGATDIPKLEQCLRKRGITERTIRKIMGENFFELLKKVLND